MKPAAAYTKDVSRIGVTTAMATAYNLADMSTDDVAIKLLASQAVRSLMSEKDAGECFTRLGWDAAHSFYYRDLESEKMREIDVLASAAWRIGNELEAPAVRVNIVIECKSNAAFHLVGAKAVRSQYFSLLPRLWLADADNFPVVMEAARAVGVDPESLKSLRKHVLDSALDDRQPDLTTRPPEAPALVSGFVETNTKDERDLDKSVFWRAVQGVSSCIASLRAQRIAAAIDEVRVSALVDEHIGDDPLAGIREHLTRQARHLELFHGIVVTESPLWVLDDDQLVSAQWLRVQLQSEVRDALPWVDVVSRDGLQDAATQMITFYQGHFQAQGATRAQWF